MRLFNFLKNLNTNRLLIGIILVALIFIAITSFVFKVSLEQTIPQFLSQLYLIFSIFVFFIFIISAKGIFESRKIVQIVKKMGVFAEKISKRDFRAKIDIERQDELGALAAALEQMKRMLKKNFTDLEREKERISSIIRNAGDAMVTINNKGKIILFNPAAEKLTGYTKEEVKEKRYSKILKLFRKKAEERVYTGLETQEEEIIFPIEKAFQTKKTVLISKDIYFKNKHGHEIAIEGNISPLIKTDSIVEGFVIIFRNVTKERELEEKKSEFISITSHQLRTPLSSIRWYLEMLLAGDAGALKKTQEDFLKEVYESTKRSIVLINNLLDVSRVESGRISITLAPTQIEDVVETVVLDLSALAKASNVKIIKKFGKILSPKVELDSNKLYQIIQNLVENAIHYSTGRGEVIISVKKIKNEVVFSCKDSGVGIPKEEQKRMFEKFFRASNIVRTGVEGSGIGLFVCRAFTKMLGGKIWFESQGKDKGATFYLSFPLK